MNLFVVLLVLKLVGFIDWSWWLVFSPLLLVVGFFFTLFIAAVVTSKK